VYEVAPATAGTLYVCVEPLPTLGQTLLTPVGTAGVAGVNGCGATTTDDNVEAVHPPLLFTVTVYEEPAANPANTGLD
jgi:hypothetical protein